MPDITSLTMPNGITYNIKDTVAREMAKKGGGSGGGSGESPISIKKGATYTTESATVDGLMQGAQFKKIADYMSTAQLTGAILTIEEQEITLSSDLMQDIAEEAKSMNYTGSSFIMVGERFLLSLDAPFELTEAQISFPEAGVYIPEGAILTTPDSVEVKEEFKPYFLPQIFKSDNDKLLVAKEGFWTPTKVTSSINGVYNYRNIKRILANGDGTTVFPLWSQIAVPHKEFGTIIFDVVDYNEENKALTLFMTDCIVPQYEFDAVEPDNPDSNRKQYGSNNYGQSAARQWLNTTAESNWWQAKTEYDVAPFYADKPGFLAGFPSDFINILSPTERKCATNQIVENGSVDGTSIVINSEYTVNDLMFLPSYTELTGENNNNIAEGTQFQVFQKYGTTASAKYDILIKRNIKTGENQWYWQRSCIPSYSGSVRTVHHDGDPRDSVIALYRSYGFAAACVIKP